MLLKKLTVFYFENNIYQSIICNELINTALNVFYWRAVA